MSGEGDPLVAEGQLRVLRLRLVSGSVVDGAGYVEGCLDPSIESGGKQGMRRFHELIHMNASHILFTARPNGGVGCAG